MKIDGFVVDSSYLHFLPYVTLFFCLSFLNNKTILTTTSWPVRASNQILCHQYRLSVTEKQMSLLARRPLRRGARRDVCQINSIVTHFTRIFLFCRFRCQGFPVWSFGIHESSGAIYSCSQDRQITWPHNPGCINQRIWQGQFGIIWKCWFLSRGETGVPREKPLGARERTNKKLQTNIWCQHWDLNPGHIDGKRVLSPLHHPCAHNNVQNNCYL